ncbi:MAG: hypothetical protein VW600_07190 [Ferrovibrio sp.]
MKLISLTAAAAALLLCCTLPAAAADTAAPEQAAIKALLSKQKTWTLYSEYTDAAEPSERAQKLQFEYYERDAKLMGRWLLAYGGCEFEVSVRADGFHFPWCPPYNGVPTLNYDAKDARYPFKDFEHPRRLWLKAAD